MTTVSNVPTIPIKQVTLKKFVPLVVSSTWVEFEIQAKLFDDQKIQTFIQEILNQFEPLKEKNPSLYAIRLCSTNQYINEKNRYELLSLNDQTRFHMVEICFNLETEVKNYLEKISSLKISNSETLINQLVSIEKYIASDRIFACEFYARGGKKILIDYIKECDKSSDHKKWNLLYHLFKILILLIRNWALISWDMSDIDLPIIKLICDTINDSTKENKKSIIPDNLVLLFLQTVDDILNNSQHTSDLILKEIKFNDITFIIQRQSVQIKEALLIFLNSCYNKCDYEFVMYLNSILTQPLMGAVMREELRMFTYVDSSRHHTNLNAPASPSMKSEAYSKYVDPKSLLPETTKKSNHLKAESHRVNEKASSSSKLSSFISQLNVSRKSSFAEFDANSSAANVNAQPSNDACRDDKNVQNVYKNFAILKKNLLDYDMGERMKIAADQHHLNKIKSICVNAFEVPNSVSVEKSLGDEEKYARLGFTNVANPLEDFRETPPGVLALDFVEYLTGKHSLRSIFQNFVVEKFSKTSDYSFPFVKASVHMVKYLCGLLNIGEKNELTKDNEILFIMFTINHDGIFEFFAKCLWLFYRLWVEMKAQYLDFDKALSALKDSLYKIIIDMNKVDSSKDLSNLNESSIVRKKLNDFNNYMETWKYDFIKNIKHRFDKFSLAPIKELEKLLTDEIIEMIRPKRIQVLTKGEKFDRINQKEKRNKQKQLWKLSSDLKTFFISDCENNETDSKVTDTIEIERIKDVKKEEPRRQYYMLSITCKRYEKKVDQNIILASQSEEIIDAWYDGISIVLNPKPTPNITCFVECLIDTQLLDLQTLNLKIPNEIPAVPELPSNFDFNIQPA